MQFVMSARLKHYLNVVAIAPDKNDPHANLKCTHICVGTHT